MTKAADADGEWEPLPKHLLDDRPGRKAVAGCTAKAAALSPKERGGGGKGGSGRGCARFRARRRNRSRPGCRKQRSRCPGDIAAGLLIRAAGGNGIQKPSGLAGGFSPRRGEGIPAEFHPQWGGGDRSLGPQPLADDGGSSPKSPVAFAAFAG